MLWLQLLKTVAALAAVLGLIFLLAWILRRAGLTAAAGDSAGEGWRLVGTRMLGPKRQVYVLEVGSHLLLVGVTDRTMTPLMEISDPAECEKVQSALSRKKAKTPISFQDLLKKAETR